MEKKWMACGFGMAFLLMGAVSIASYQNATQLIQSDDKVEHTHEVLKALTDVLVNLTDAESGRRGYILFRDEEELELYNSAVQRIDPKIQRLRQLTADNPSQQHRLAILDSLILQRIALFQQSVDLYQEGKTARSAQSTLIVESKRNRDKIRKVIAEIQSEEEQLLEMWVGQYESSIHYRMPIELIGTFLTFAILLGVYALLYQQMVKRQQAETLQRSLAQEKELSELKIRFFSMVSHEFRTPLSVILGSAQLLAESSQQWTEDKRLKNLHRIQSSAKLMTQLLSDILTLTRAEAGKLECQPEVVDMESFCLNLVEDIQFGSAAPLAIKFTSQGSRTHAYLDEKLARSILSNLLSNASKYSPQGGEIHLILSCEPEAVIFKIKDGGIGIPLEDQDKLYEPFHRGKNVGNIAGTGLGLAVVKTCVALHGGQIFVESNVGVGTTFTVKIPQASAARAQER
ncbi:sensor histidine kinase [Kamptonema formosum]|uniref:sensor histidine kinase n=1 Tax=Kamptonema formosum TaxID=331992 RepID=UPI0003648D52|nr:CHASE3 domain-containing protein [Oscillatoria sp. PCC 10802]